jgi:hypothetical protein
MHFLNMPSLMESIFGLMKSFAKDKVSAKSFGKLYQKSGSLMVNINRIKLQLEGITILTNKKLGMLKLMF